MQEKRKAIRQHLPDEELCAQLAEECTELAHAALKYRRAIKGNNPTPVSVEAAIMKIYEELADVMNALDCLGILPDCCAVLNIKEEKLDRWLQRLEDKK